MTVLRRSFSKNETQNKSAFCINSYMILLRQLLDCWLRYFDDGTGIVVVSRACSGVDIEDELFEPPLALEKLNLILI